MSNLALCCEICEKNAIKGREHYDERREKLRDFGNVPWKWRQNKWGEWTVKI